MKYLISFFLLASLFLSSCTHLYYQPSRYLYAPPEKLGLKYENRMIESQDGTRLHSWYFPTAKSKKGLVVLFHGNAQNLSAHYLSVSWMTRYGYDVWVWDYRGYGLSQGESNSQGIFEDTQAALDYVHEIKEGKLILIGQSLGGNLLMKALEESPHKDDADLIVLDSTFLSYEELAQDKLASVWFFWPLQWLAYPLISDEYNPEENLNRIQKPVLVMHGTDDTVIPLSYGKEVYEKLTTKKKWFWKVEEGKHIGTLGSGKGPYEKKLIELIDSI